VDLLDALNMSVKHTENFLGAFEKKGCSSKSEVLSEYSSFIPFSFFENLNFFHFS